MAASPSMTMASKPSVAFKVHLAFPDLPSSSSSSSSTTCPPSSFAAARILSSSSTLTGLMEAQGKSGNIQSCLCFYIVDSLLSFDRFQDQLPGSALIDAAHIFDLDLIVATIVFRCDMLLLLGPIGLELLLDSEWAPYIGCLPLPGEIHSTIFWDEDEMNMIKPSSVCNATGNQRSQIIKEYLTVKPVLDRFPEFFQDCTLDDFTHAYALVGLRAWGSMKGLSLIPFADFLNHDGTSVSIVLSDDLKQISEVIADRNYAPGEEILIRYGKFPNSTLLIDFGFTLAYNIHDQVQIQIDIPDHDHLRTMKLDILHIKHFSAIKDTSFNSAGGSFLIKSLLELMQ